MNIFDIVGPVMVGPSSSHTAGAARIGLIARTVLNQTPTDVLIRRHGSFAQTYAGHRSDLAVIGGLLGYATYDPRISKSFQNAEKAGMKFNFINENRPNAHPNTLVIEATSKDGKSVKLVGASVGGGNVVINKIDGIEMSYTGQNKTLVVKQKDEPGVIWHIAEIIAKSNINIDTIHVTPSKKDSTAVTVIETSSDLSDELLNQIKNLENVLEIINLPALSATEVK